MNVSIPKAAIHRLATHVATVVESKPTQPILGNILLQLAGDTLTAMGTNVATTIVETEVAMGLKDGSVAVPKADLLMAINAMPNAAAITLASDGKKFTVSAGKRSISVPCAPGSDFPNVPAWPANGAELTLPAARLAQILKRTASSRNEDKSRPNLCATLLETPRAGVLRAVATTGSRMAIAETGGGERFPSALVPNESGNALLAITSERSSHENITLIHGGHMIGARRGSLRFVSLLVNETFVPYQQVLPESYIWAIDVATSQLKDSLSAVQSVAERVHGTTRCRLEVKGGTIHLLSVDSRDAKGDDQVPCTVDDSNGKPNVMYFNSAHMVDILSLAATDRVKIEFGAELEPIAIRESEGSDLWILMPMMA